MIKNRESTRLDKTKEKTKPFTVLVVDDEDYITAFIRIKLKVSGYNILTAGNALTALKLLKKHTIDLAIVDIMMPEVNGLELIKQMRVFTQIPVIVLTAMNSIDIKLQSLSIGADDFITKPFDPDELVARIEGIRRRSGKISSN